VTSYQLAYLVPWWALCPPPQTGESIDCRLRACSNPNLRTRLDGLNKDLDSWNTRYYIHNFKLDCDRVKVPQLDYPRRDYIIQVARFDPAKGIPDAIKSYAKLRRDLYRAADVPQLLITGVSAIDDPDGTLIYDQTMELLESYPDIASDVCVMRVGPTDQLLNALMSQAKSALQLSTREGFEVKVSEAVHKGYVSF